MKIFVAGVLVKCRFFVSFRLDTSALTEAHTREIQRRSDAAIEHASVLPPDVVSVLTQCDQIEQRREEIHQQSHGKLLETIEKFFTKLEAEEKKYRTRMEELQVILCLHRKRFY